MTLCNHYLCTIKHGRSIYLSFNERKGAFCFHFTYASDLEQVKRRFKKGKYGEWTHIKVHPFLYIFPIYMIENTYRNVCKMFLSISSYYCYWK